MIAASANQGLGAMALTKRSLRGSAFQARLLKESRQDAAPTDATDVA